MTDQRLNTVDVATFAARGVLALPGVVPDEINAAAIDECRQILATWGTSERRHAPTSGQSLDEIYPGDSAVGSMLRSDAVAGAILSLAGPAPRFDHDFVHLKPAGDLSFQSLHADAVIDHTTAFDIQVFYFPHAVDDGAGEPVSFPAPISATSTRRRSAAIATSEARSNGPAQPDPF